MVDWWLSSEIDEILCDVGYIISKSIGKLSSFKASDVEKVWSKYYPDFDMTDIPVNADCWIDCLR